MYWVHAPAVPMKPIRRNLGLIFSARGCSPTKLGEMLAMGVPVVPNAGVSDVEQIIHSEQAGVAIDRFDPATYRTAVDALLELRRSGSQLQESSRKWFDLDSGIQRYDEIYRRMNGGSDRAPTGASHASASSGRRE